MGFSRYAIEKKQVSVDRGVTWIDVEPSETQRGQLLGTYRTLVECEDASCELEEYRYELYDAERQDTYCGVKIPYGYAKIITFTSGAIICGVQPSSLGGCKITWDSSHAVQYSKYLYEKGIDKILKKVGEEATEMVIAAKNPNDNEVIYEMSDFLYHMMVLMAVKNVSWEDITDELSRR